MLGPIGAIGGAIATEEFTNQSSKDVASIADHDDGPGWWTGYFCLPRVIQYRNAAILFYRYPWLQRTLSDHDTHLFLPESGLTEHVEIEPNRDNLDDTDSPLEDIEEFFSNIVSRKHGIWLFGRVLHEADIQNPTLDQEAYTRVFSESRWDELDKDYRFYKDQVTNELGKDTTLLADYFKDRDRYATGDSVWSIQVGNKAEYGSFEAFKDRAGAAHTPLLGP
jgi:hypothetical protein